MRKPLIFSSSASPHFIRLSSENSRLKISSSVDFGIRKNGTKSSIFGSICFSAKALSTIPLSWGILTTMSSGDTLAFKSFFAVPRQLTLNSRLRFFCCRYSVNAIIILGLACSAFSQTKNSLCKQHTLCNTDKKHPYNSYWMKNNRLGRLGTIGHTAYGLGSHSLKHLPRPHIPKV